MPNLLNYPVLDLETGGVPAPTGAPETTPVNENPAPSLLSEAPVSDETHSGNSENNLENSTNELKFPEKYTVKNEDGSINIEETAKKLTNGYNNLAKKMGETGGKVPDNPNGYKIEFDPKTYNLPETVTPDILKSDESFTRFLTKAHESGFTNEQINLVAGEYIEAVHSLFDRKTEDDKKFTQETLAKVWKTPDEMNQNLMNARKAFEHFASPEEKAQIDSIGNNPVVISLLAKIGKTMREDSPVQSGMNTESRENIKSLMASEAYLNYQHPDHNKIAQKVSEYYRNTLGDEIIY